MSKKMFEAVVAPEETGGGSRRLDVYWHARLGGEHLTRGRIQSWIKAGLACVDGVPCRKPAAGVAPGQRLTLEAEEIASEVEPESGDLDLVYEDDDLLVLNKPAGLTVHPAPSQPAGTLVNRLAARFPDMAKLDRLRPGVVHRIDKDTSGLLVAVRTEAAKNALAAAFAERRVRKTYLALVHGRPDAPEGEIDLPIGRDPRRKTRMAVVKKGGRRAFSRYRVVWTAPDEAASLLEVEIETGRTHQIRVHLAAVGRPLLGDVVYGAQAEAVFRRERPVLARLIRRQMLHAWRLGFEHPTAGRDMAFEQPPPKNFWRTPLLLARRTQRIAAVGMPGSGKSAFLGRIAAAGFPVWSADAAVALLYEPGRDGAALLRARFGERVLNAAGGVDKAFLLREMFASDAFRREVEDLVHPLVKERMRAFFREHAGARAAFAEIPLLHESGWGGGAFDAVVGVARAGEARREALAQRPGWDAETAARIESGHWAQDKKLRACTHVVDNNGTLEDLAANTAALLETLRDERRAATRGLLTWLRERGFAEAERPDKEAGR